jgi:hypothetical protein
LYLNQDGFSRNNENRERFIAVKHLGNSMGVRVYAQRALPPDIPAGYFLFFKIVHLEKGFS